jgi:P27 family predicted phage terminase small subunit
VKGRKPAQIIAGNVDTVPAAPAWLSKDARAEWRRVMPELVERRVLTGADLAMVEAYCVALGRVRQFERVLQAAGDDVDLKVVRAQDKAMVTARQIAAEIGATPVSRSRPTVTADTTDDEPSPLDVA